MPVADLHARPVPAGPRAYRRRILIGGPLLGLLVPALVMLAATAIHRTWTCPGKTCIHRTASGYVLPGMALPTALPWGIPLRSGTYRYVGMAATSALLWVLLGLIAARRATRRPVASWRDWWREYAWCLIGVWVGVSAAAALLVVGMGKSLFV